MKVGDRVAVNVEWSEAYNVPCTIVEIDEDEIVAQLIADEPCFDNGKYQLDREGDCVTDWLRLLTSITYTGLSS